MTREERRKLIVAPLLIWGGLMTILAATIVYAYLPGAPFKTEVALALALAKAGLIAFLFMQLKQAAAIVRLAAAIGVVWATFLYLFAFADFLTR